ncbi:MAG: LysM peptidoglycan-binding domain-containing protein, partial [Flavobacteriales bacterium]|nr:LysM peptidoglycan-binding domain-containing protein [Flavobacteriales bacterium]
YVSHDGRAGIWNLDYLIARKQHLRIDTFVDERRGGDFTTDAAMAWLSELYTGYGHDADKTFLAYVRSPLYLSQHVDTGGHINWTQIDNETMELVLWWKFTTSLFTRNQQPNRLPFMMELYADYEGIFVTHEVSLDALVHVYKTDMKMLRAINPVYTGQVIDSSFRKVPFMLPVSAATRFKTDPAELYAWKPDPEPAALELITYRVKKGDSLGAIANKFDTSVATLKKLNNLRTDRIQPGQVLRISAPARPAEKQEAPSSDSPVRYTVKSGDSLWRIARRYPGVTENDIKEWNKCGDDIRPGQVLLIYPSN